MACDMYKIVLEKLDYYVGLLIVTNIQHDAIGLFASAICKF